MGSLLTVPSSACCGGSGLPRRRISGVCPTSIVPDVTLVQGPGAGCDERRRSGGALRFLQGRASTGCGSCHGRSGPAVLAGPGFLVVQAASAWFGLPGGLASPTAVVAASGSRHHRWLPTPASSLKSDHARVGQAPRFSSVGPCSDGLSRKPFAAIAMQTVPSFRSARCSATPARRRWTCSAMGRLDGNGSPVAPASPAATGAGCQIAPSTIPQSFQMFLDD